MNCAFVLIWSRNGSLIGRDGDVTPRRQAEGTQQQVRSHTYAGWEKSPGTLTHARSLTPLHASGLHPFVSALFLLTLLSIRETEVSKGQRGCWGCRAREELPEPVERRESPARQGSPAGTGPRARKEQGYVRYMLTLCVSGKSSTDSIQPILLLLSQL